MTTQADQGLLGDAHIDLLAQVLRTLSEAGIAVALAAFDYTGDADGSIYGVAHIERSIEAIQTVDKHFFCRMDGGGAENACALAALAASRAACPLRELRFSTDLEEPIGLDSVCVLDHLPAVTLRSIRRFSILVDLSEGDVLEQYEQLGDCLKRMHALEDLHLAFGCELGIAFLDDEGVTYLHDWLQGLPLRTLKLSTLILGAADLLYILAPHKDSLRCLHLSSVELFSGDDWPTALAQIAHRFSLEQFVMESLCQQGGFVNLMGGLEERHCKLRLYSSEELREAVTQMVVNPWLL